MRPWLFISGSARIPVLVVAGLSVASVAIAATLAGEPEMPFGAYFGAIPAVTATLIVVAVAAMAHWTLQASRAFQVIRPNTPWQALLMICIVGALFAVPTILMDIVLRFPADINAPLPGALLFYPLMGYVAETAFHLVPLAVLVLVTRVAFDRFPGSRLLAAFIVVVALVEPVVQASGTFNAATPAALDIFMLAHLSVFSLVLLTIYRRYGFLAAYAFRLSYYLVWHIAWGWTRLAALY